MRKFICLLLTIAMALSMVTFAFAVDSGITNFTAVNQYQNSKSMFLENGNTYTTWIVDSFDITNVTGTLSFY